MKAVISARKEATHHHVISFIMTAVQTRAVSRTSFEYSAAARKHYFSFLYLFWLIVVNSTPETRVKSFSINAEVKLGGLPFVKLFFLERRHRGARRNRVGELLRHRG